jgi:DNA-binding response OmpR family regulator
MKKILIVEDDERIAKALAVRLRAEGYNTAVALDALTGVSTAVRYQPDLTLLDISMPAGSGFTVAERLRELMPQPIPIIFLTASKKPDLFNRAIELGARGYFEKPFSAQALLSSIRRALGEAPVCN